MNVIAHRRPWFLVPLLLAAAAGLLSNRSLLAQAPADAIEAEEEVVVVEEDASPTVPAGEIKTVAVIAASSYGDLVSDVGFLGSLAERPELGQMIEGTIALFTQGKGLVGLDKSKPWGVILQTDGQNFLPVGCLPVTDLGQALQVVQGFGIQIEDGDDGVKKIPLPSGQTLHIKHNGAWAYVATSADALAMLPDDPQAALADLISDYDLGARIAVQNVPETYRQQAIAAMKGGVEQGLERKEGEDDETYEMRRQVSEVQMEQLERMINEIDEMVIGVAVDAQQQRTFADFTYRFLPESKLARQIASYGQPRTNFAGFYQPDAAVTMSFASKSDPDAIKEDLDRFRSMMQTVRKQAEKEIDAEEDIPDDETRDAIKAAMGDLFDAIQATIEAGQMDGGAAVHLEPDSLTLVVGALVKEPAKLESGLKKIAAVAQKEPEFSGVQWNAANHAGVSFHTMSVPVPEDEADARKLLGEKVDVAIGIGTDAVYAAVGKDNLNAINRAIDASQADPGKEVPPFEFSLSLGQIMTMAAANADDEDRETAQAVADMLQNEAQGRDHVRMTATLIENGLRYRIEAEEGVLRAIGKAAMMAQQKAQQEALQGAQQGVQ